MDTLPIPQENQRSPLNVYEWSIHLIDPKKKDAAWGLSIVQWYRPLCLPFSEAFYAYGGGAFNTDLIHQYATGTQSPDIYKAIFDPIEKKAAYMGVNFDMIPAVIPKFRQIMADNIIKIPVEIVATATDPIANNKRGKDKERLKMQKALDEELAKLSRAVGYQKPIKSGIDKQILKTPMGNGSGMDMSQFDMENDEELDLMMQSYYSMDVEVASELGIQGLFDQDQIVETKKSWVYDAIDYGCAAGRVYCSDYTGLPKTEYLDVRNLRVPFTERRDAKNVPIWMYPYMLTLNQCIEYMGDELTPKLLEQMYVWAVKYYGYRDFAGNAYDWNNRAQYNRTDFNAISLPMTYFEFQSPNCEVYEESKTKYGNTRLKKKEYDYKPPTEDKKRNEYWKFAVYGGYYLQGMEKVFKFGPINHMITEPGREQMTPYSLVFYLMDERSMIEKMIPHADNIVIAWLKLQQTLIDSKPPGYFFNWDVMSDIVVGDGGKITGLQLAALFKQTGSTFYKSINEGGEGILANPNAPHMVAANGLPANFMGYWESIRQEMDMIRQEIGLNEFTDASTPAAKALVGVQKNAVYSSNSARQYLTDGIRNMIEDAARYTSLLIGDIAQYNKPAFEKIKDIVGRFNSAVLESMDKMYLNQIGIRLEDELTETEKAEIRQLIIQEYAQGKLGLEDVLLIYFIRNYKLAARLLSLKSKKRAAQAAQAQQAQLQIQAKTEQEIAQVKILLQQLDNQGKAGVATIQSQSNIQAATIKEHGDLLRKILTESSKHEADRKQQEHDKAISDKEHRDTMSEIALKNLGDLNLQDNAPKAEAA